VALISQVEVRAVVASIPLARAISGRTKCRSTALLRLKHAPWSGLDPTLSADALPEWVPATASPLEKRDHESRETSVPYRAGAEMDLEPVLNFNLADRHTSCKEKSLIVGTRLRCK
jgi:hypothetical protein